MGETMRFGVNKRVPWLKFGVVGVIVFFGFLVFRGTFRYFSGEKGTVIPRTPMLSQVKVPERVFRGDLNGKKLVALTFDDGPYSETTPRLLDILKEKGAVATFFELGMRAKDNTEITKRVFEEGHEVGSHTMYHQDLIELSNEAVEGDIKEANAVFEEILGIKPKITRVPYGNSNQFIREHVKTPLIYWSVDTKDWETKDTNKVVEETMKATSDGAIILYHDIYGSTVDAIPIVIDQLRDQGYEFVTVSELAELRGVRLENGEVYTKFEP